MGISNTHPDAATETTLAAKASEVTLAALNTKVITVDTGNTVIGSSALPVGASTASNQDTGNTSLASIDSKDFATQVTLASIKIKTDLLTFLTDRLKVDTALTSVSLGATVNECNIFFADLFTITTKNETTIRTYTVPTGKTFRLVVFRASVDHPLAIDINLKLDGVTKIRFYLDPGWGATKDEFISSPIVFATAGQVVTITEDPSTARGEVNTIFAGIEL